MPPQTFAGFLGIDNIMNDNSKSAILLGKQCQLKTVENSATRCT